MLYIQENGQNLEYLLLISGFHIAVIYLEYLRLRFLAKGITQNLMKSIKDYDCEGTD